MTFAISPPPPLVFIFQANLSGPPFWVFSDPPFWVLSYDRSPLFFSNSASFSTKGIKLDIICCYRARLLCETAHRGTTEPAKLEEPKKNDCFYYKFLWLT